MKIRKTSQKKALFCLILPGLMASCKSREEKLAEYDAKISKIEAQIDSLESRHQKAIQDSVARTPTYTILQKWIEEDSREFDEKILRNENILNTIHENQLRRIARKYPLTTFLSKHEIHIIRKQLQASYQGNYAQKCTRNILASRGTLWDLYCVSYQLDYMFEELPFHIINDFGYLRFKNQNLNALCKKFERELEETYSNTSSNFIQDPKLRSEFEENQTTISAFNRKCEMCDSIYATIHNTIHPRFQQPLDSLNTEKAKLQQKKQKLLNEIQFAKAK